MGIVGIVLQNLLETMKLQDLTIDQFQRIVVSPCSISAIMYGPTGPVVLAVNSTGDDLRSLVPS